MAHIDDVIIEPVEGTEYSTPPSAETERLILNSKDNTTKLVHYHPSGSSFSGEDLGTFSDVHAFSEIRATTADGWTFSMSIKPDSKRPSSEEVVYTAQLADSQLNSVLMPKVRAKEITMAEKRVLSSRGICQILKKKYNWEYEEIPPNGK